MQIGSHAPYGTRFSAVAFILPMPFRVWPRPRAGEGDAAYLSVVSLRASDVRVKTEILSQFYSR
jgi:hypothetical protein